MRLYSVIKFGRMYRPVHLVWALRWNIEGVVCFLHSRIRLCQVTNATSTLQDAEQADLPEAI